MGDNWIPLKNLRYSGPTGHRIKGLPSMSEEEKLKMELSRSPAKRMQYYREAEQAEKDKLKKIHQDELNKLPEMVLENQSWIQERDELKALGINLMHIRSREIAHERRAKEIERKWKEGEL
jgi:hypothetical protein